MSLAFKVAKLFALKVEDVFRPRLASERHPNRMSEPSYEFRVQVGSGEGAARILTGDLTAEYVRINADYST